MLFSFFLACSRDCFGVDYAKPTQDVHIRSVSMPFIFHPPEDEGCFRNFSLLLFQPSSVSARFFACGRNLTCYGGGAGIAIGSEMSGGVENILVENITYLAGVWRFLSF